MRFGNSTRAAIALAGMVAAFGFGRAGAGARDKADSTIVGAYGVGGVLTESGALYQYLPDAKRWMTIDEAFQHDQRQGTHILPLPVPAKSIRFMQSWGFLVTTAGKAWLYDQDANKWVEIGTP